MQNVKRRLLSLNFAILMLLTVIFPAGAVGVSPSDADATHQYEQYISINGTEYDATEDHSGEGWRYKHRDYRSQLKLYDYNGDSILSNVPISIDAFGENVISGSTYGVCAPETLWLGTDFDGDPKGSLVIKGAPGYAAVCAEYADFDGDVTAIGGGCAAIESSSIWYYWAYRIFVGSSSADAVEGDYTDQSYVSFERMPYQMTLHGNGGVNETSNTEKQIIFTNGTSGYLFLYPHFKTFTKDSKPLLGWTDTADGTGFVYPVDDYYHYPDNTYTADLYAVWEDTNYKAVVLKNYYGMYSNNDGAHEGDTLPIAVKTGDEYTLPEQVRSGCKFDGWLAEDGKLYSAGTVFTVTQSMTFTAQFTTLKLKIDGTLYDADKKQHGVGWNYYPGIDCAQLDIFNTYPGLPIEVPTTVDIDLHKSMTSEAGITPIVVHGDIFLSSGNQMNRSDNPVTLTGGENAPAIQADGQVSISVSDYDDNNFKLILKSGGTGVPAIKAAHVKCHAKMFHAGTDAANTSVVYRYSNEEYAEITEVNSYIITVTGRCTLPELPEFDDEIAVGWCNTAIDFSENEAT